MIYLDNAATTKVDPDVFTAMLPYLTDHYGNPSTMYALGREAKAAVEKARCQVAQFINADPSQIIFTSGGTEGNNMVFQMAEGYMRARGLSHVAVSEIEHKSVLRAAEKLCDDNDWELSYINCSQNLGYAKLIAVEKAMFTHTGLVSVMHTNNETGLSNKDLKSIAELCHEKGVLFHTDCVQAAGCQKIDVQEIGCDFATISSHKIHGPKGVGAIYIKDKTLFDPMILGGYDQEFGMRGGTENVPGIVGLGEACDILNKWPVDISKRFNMYRIAFSGVLFEMLKECGVSVGSVKLGGAGKVIMLTVDGVDAQSMILMLEGSCLCVSAGSACNTQDNIPSYVLKSLGMTDDQARSTLRISFSRMNTIEEAVEAAKIVSETVAILKGM